MNRIGRLIWPAFVLVVFSAAIFVRAAPCDVCGGDGRVPKEPCRECGGRGRRVERTKVSVDVPAGISYRMLLLKSGANTLPVASVIAPTNRALVAAVAIVVTVCVPAAIFRNRLLSLLFVLSS